MTIDLCLFGNVANRFLLAWSGAKLPQVCDFAEGASPSCRMCTDVKLACLEVSQPRRCCGLILCNVNVRRSSGACGPKIFRYIGSFEHGDWFGSYQLVCSFRSTIGFMNHCVSAGAHSSSISSLNAQSWNLVRPVLEMAAPSLSCLNLATRRPYCFFAHES